ncbi:MAG TPA: Rieske 2Fe-2S domain-containing protein [Candidatus Limnocylindrales bacterium]|nr:Rieske 2Fe-2S domain-containing protein [Candidatus Limnocylindrales bacterium]
MSSPRATRAPRDTPLGAPRPARERRAERAVLLAFGVTGLSGVALLVVYALGGQTQLEGLLLAVCLGGLGVGIVVWAQELMSGELRIEPRHRLGGGREASEAVADALTDEEGFSRRRILQVGLLGAFAGLGSALLVPVLSLGPAPGRSLFRTPWTSGARLVGFDGRPVNLADVPSDGVVTVFPEGFAGNAEAQTVLINAGATRLRLEGDAATWAPEGFVAYSKLCTHAGCPVGLYRASEGALICPCHQSTFDVMTGAVPTFGPAARALPQLPIRLEADGTFTALGDFPEPVGPSFWNLRLGPVDLGAPDEDGTTDGSSDAEAAP